LENRIEKRSPQTSYSKLLRFRTIPIPRKVTSRTHDYAIRTKARKPVCNHVTEIDQWKYSNMEINMGVSTQFRQLISWAYQSQHVNQKWSFTFLE